MLNCKISETKEDGIYDVLFNQGYLVPFKFDGKKFMVERVEKKALEEFRKKKEEEEKKLNRKKNTNRRETRYGWDEQTSKGIWRHQSTI